MFLERFNWGKKNPRGMWAAACPPWSGILDWTQRRRWARHQHPSLSTSFLWMPRDQIPHTPAALPSPAKLNLTPVSSVCWAACHSNGKKKDRHASSLCALSSPTRDTLTTVDWQPLHGDCFSPRTSKQLRPILQWMQGSIETPGRHELFQWMPHTVAAVLKGRIYYRQHN